MGKNPSKNSQLGLPEIPIGFLLGSFVYSPKHEAGRIWIPVMSLFLVFSRTLDSKGKWEQFRKKLGSAKIKMEPKSILVWFR